MRKEHSQGAGIHSRPSRRTFLLETAATLGITALPSSGAHLLPAIPPGFLDNLSLNYKVQRAAFEEIGVPDDIVRRGRELYYGLTD